MNKKAIGLTLLGLTIAGIAGYYYWTKSSAGVEASINSKATSPADDAAYQQMKSTFTSMLQDGEGVWSWLVKDVDERIKNPSLIGNPEAAGTKTAALYSAIVTRVQAWTTGGPGTPTLYPLTAGTTYQQFSDTLWQQWVAFKNSQLYAGL